MYFFVFNYVRFYFQLCTFSCSLMYFSVGTMCPQMINIDQVIDRHLCMLFCVLFLWLFSIQHTFPHDVTIIILKDAMLQRADVFTKPCTQWSCLLPSDSYILPHMCTTIHWGQCFMNTHWIFGTKIEYVISDIVCCLHGVNTATEWWYNYVLC